jgi:16S rRNA (guanine966-N2)-methyltransferase
MTRKIRGRNLKDWQLRTTGNRKPSPGEQSRSGRASAELRIIGGALRGRKFAYSGDPRTRPMMDVTREALFNLVGAWVEGKHAIDLFSGTGAVGFEAISRGALKATLIERHIPTTELLKQNRTRLNIESQVEVVQADTFFWVDEFIKSEFDETPWLVFCCPPYDFYVDRKSEMLTLIERLFHAAPADSLFAVESDIRFGFKQLPDAERWKVRQYSPAQIAVYRGSEQAE